MALDIRVARRAIAIVQDMKDHTGSIFDGGDHYCRHGVNVGNWAGADLMCGACEDGISDYAYALMCARDGVRRDDAYAERQMQEKFYDNIMEAFEKKVMSAPMAMMMYRELQRP